MEQGTQEWKDLRRTKIGASDASAILGICPYRTRYELWMEKVFGTEQEQNSGMARGSAMESEARDCFEKLTGMPVLPKVVIHKERSWQMASLDGISLDGNTIVEIKCPRKEVHAVAEKGIIPQHYMAQIQHQFSVTGAVKGYYFSYNGTQGVLVEVFPDDKFIAKMIKEEEKFFKLMTDKEAPELTDSDYVEKEEKSFLDLMDEYKEVTDEIDVLKSAQDAIKEKLIEKAAGKNTICSKGKMTRSVCRGQVDYKLVPELIGIDLEAYRKPPCEKWRISVISRDGA